MRSALSSHLASALSLRYFYLPSGAELSKFWVLHFCYRITYFPISLTADNFSTYIFEGDVPPISPISCLKISSLQDDTWDGAFCIVSNGAS